jgi:hypothetical protein
MYEADGITPLMEDWWFSSYYNVIAVSSQANGSK